MAGLILALAGVGLGCGGSDDAPAPAPTPPPPPVAITAVDPAAPAPPTAPTAPPPPAATGLPAAMPAGQVVTDEATKPETFDTRIPGLQEAAESYKREYGKYPANFEELVRTGRLEAVPRPVKGKRFVIDQETGEVTVAQ